MQLQSSVVAPCAFCCILPGGPGGRCIPSADNAAALNMVGPFEAALGCPVEVRACQPPIRVSGALFVFCSVPAVVWRLTSDFAQPFRHSPIRQVRLFPAFQPPDISGAAQDNARSLFKVRERVLVPTEKPAIVLIDFPELIKMQLERVSVNQRGSVVGGKDGGGSDERIPSTRKMSVLDGGNPGRRATFITSNG